MEFQILHAIQSMRTEALDMFMLYYSTLGNHGLIWIFLSIGMIAFPATRLIGKTAILSLIFEVTAVTFTIKPIVDRVRPCIIEAIQSPLLVLDSPSFPSGHTASSFAVAMVIFCFNRTWGTVALLAAALMGFTRLYLFVHFPSDVIVGALIGILCGYVAYRLYSRFEAQKK